MSAVEVLAAARAAGVEVRRVGARFQCRTGQVAGRRLLVALLRAHRAELLELLPDTTRVFSAEEEILFRFARMRRQVGPAGPPAELACRPGLLRVPERCPSCGELFDSGPEGRPCPLCEDTAAIVRQLHAEGRLWPAQGPQAAA